MDVSVQKATHSHIKSLITTAKYLSSCHFERQALKILNSTIDLQPVIKLKKLNLYASVVRSLLTPFRSAIFSIKENIEIERKNGDSQLVILYTQIQQNIFSDILIIGQEFLSVIEQQLIPGNTDPEILINLKRYQGDVYRYFLESTTENQESFLSKSFEIL